LHATGHTVHGVLTAGHGTAVDDLARTSRHDWIASARAGLAELQRQTDTVVVIGLSMGALLALALAHDHPGRVSGIVALSPALLLRDQRIERYRWLLRVAVPLLPPRWQFIAKQGRDIADPAARAASPTYEAIPLRSLVQLIELQRHVRSLLPAIPQPVLAIHARQDHACPLENVTLLQQRLPAAPQVEVLENSFHVITLDYDHHRVADRVCDFVGVVAAGR
jgi:carboxylesterase